ncbi:hypothetical protein H5410_057505, partial [Solanum commersonii]
MERVPAAGTNWKGTGGRRHTDWASRSWAKSLLDCAALGSILAGPRKGDEYRVCALVEKETCMYWYRGRFGKVVRM